MIERVAKLALSLSAMSREKDKRRLFLGFEGIKAKVDGALKGGQIDDSFAENRAEGICIICVYNLKRSEAFNSVVLGIPVDSSNSFARFDFLN